MPMAPLRYCTVRPWCRTLINRTQRGCPVCLGLKDKARPNANLRRFYFTAKWERARLKQLADHPECYDHWERGQLEPATDVHHKRKPTTAEEFFDSRFFGSLCHSCHSKRTARGE